MKKLIVLSAGILLIGCTQQMPQGNVQMDMKTLQEYNQRVSSGNTVPADQKQAYSKEVDHELNASDSRPKVQTRTIYRPTPMMFLPSVSYRYNYNYNR
ncbi:hypothetical protein I926_03425 [Pasteurella multocida subsp. multocida OH4807]|nr:hypothetical protein I926_03425 [Pasteurella multocida subsp. multocida OH4807]